MNLFIETKSFYIWFASITHALVKSQRRITLTVIVLATLSKLFRFASSVLPFKVILLAGSSTIPSYFRFLISDPADRGLWITALAIATIIFYILTVLLDAVTSRLALLAGTKIIEKANKLAVFSNQEHIIQRDFSIVCQIWANVIFSVTTIFIGVIFFDAKIFSVIVGLLVIAYLFNAVIFRGSSGKFAHKIRYFAESKLGIYINTIASIIFLTVFLLIFSMLMEGGGGSTLIAIASFIALRQLLNSITSVVIDSHRLNNNRVQFDVLVFREAFFGYGTNKSEADFRGLFSRERRRRHVQAALRRIGVMGGFRVSWAYSLHEISMFDVLSEDSQDVRYQLQVFPERHVHRLQNEDMLFSGIDRKGVNAPNMVARYAVGSFQCQLVDVIGFSKIDAQRFPEYERQFTLASWKQSPNKELIDSYKSSHALLSTRMSRAFLERIKIAIDNDEQSYIFNKYLSLHKNLMSMVDTIPLFVRNTQNLRTIMIANGNLICVPFWSFWEIVPIGSFLPSSCVEYIEPMLDEVGNIRNIDKNTLNIHNVLLVGLVCSLEKNVLQSRYIEALDNIQNILDKYC